jgi:hypothetical protein
MGNGVVMVCGSRSLSASAVPLVNQVVQSLLSAGRGIAVGCAAGADATVISSVLAAGASSQLRVFAAFGPGGAGAAGSVSAVSVVSQAATNGVPVTWWAGGPASVPLRGLLASRSLACVRSVVGSGAGAGLVAFVSALPSRSWGSGAFPSCGSGSWSSVAAAAKLGLPVVVFPVGALVGVASAQLPVLPVSAGGAWSCAGVGIWSGAWRWQPSKNLF